MRWDSHGAELCMIFTPLPLAHFLRKRYLGGYLVVLAGLRAKMRDECVFEHNITRASGFLVEREHLRER